MKRKSDIEFTIKNRMLDLVAKLFSVKMFWAFLVTIIFLTTDKVDSGNWLLFIASVIGVNMVEKSVHIWNKERQQNIETVETEPEI